MLFKKHILSEAHNRLLYHSYLKSLSKNIPFIHGRILDIGCGKKPYKKYFESNSNFYIGVEYLQTLHGFSEVDVAGNSLALPFKDNSFDSVVSFQVMEHIPEPLIFLQEAYRIAKPGSYFLLTTPFMWGEHETPHDYFRYTRYGLKYLAEKAGFEVISITPDTKYWTTAVLRFNYYLIRFARGPFKKIIKLLMMPVFFIDQLFASVMDSLPHNYTIDTASFTTLLKKS